MLLYSQVDDNKAFRLVSLCSFFRYIPGFSQCMTPRWYVSFLTHGLNIKKLLHNLKLKNLKERAILELTLVGLMVLKSISEE